MKDTILYGEKSKIDNKDKKIIKSLYENGRATITQIEKKTGIRRDSVSYRIKKLLERGIISCIIPIINPGKLGYNLINEVLIRTKVGTKEQEERFIKKLKNNSFVIYLAVLSGRWDFNLTVCAKNPEHFNEILKEIRAIESDYIKEFEIFTIVSEEKYESSLGLLD